MTYDYDWIVVGSGFGGSVSALRLAEKGYTVAVLECGKRFTRRRLPQLDLGQPPLLLGAADGDEGDLPAQPLQGRRRGQRLRRRRRQPRLRQHALRPPLALLRRPAVGRPRELGGARSPPTTKPRSGCSASSSTTRTTRPTSCCASSARSWASPTPTARRRSGSTSTTRARPSPTPTSKARGRSGPAACSAAAAWSAARTAPRTRWSRTTSGWPSTAASRCRPSAP